MTIPFMQYRPSGSNDPLYAPKRDVAYIYGSIARNAIAMLDQVNWQDWYGEYLNTTGTTEDQLGEGAKLFAEAHNLFTGDDEVASAYDALVKVGFFKLPYPVQITIFAALGSVLTGTFLSAIRDVTMHGEEPPKQCGMKELVAAGTAVMQRLTHAGKQPGDALVLPVLDQFEMTSLRLRSEPTRQRLQQVLGMLKCTLPQNYTIFDIETTGFKSSEDLIVEVGYAVVRNCQLASIGGCLLNWTDSGIVSPHWLQLRIERTRDYMATRREVYAFTPELLRTGDSPLAVLNEYKQLLADAVARREFVVGHNVWRFDRNMLDAACYRFLGEASRVPWTDNSIIDTGLLEKAVAIGQRGELWPGDTLTSYFRRLDGIVGQGKWSLAGCLEKYGLTRHLQVTPEQAHRAYYGCLSVYHLYETWRRVLYG